MAPFSSWHQKQRALATGHGAQANKVMLREKLWTPAFTKIWLLNLAMCGWAFMLNATFPFYIKHLGGTELLVGITAGGFALTSLIMRPMAGWMLDNKSRSGLLKGGMVGLTIITLLYLFVPVLGLVMGLRWFSGFVLSGVTTATNTNACDVIPPSRFGEGIGILGMGNTLATALGPALGLAIMARLGFDMLFIVSIVLVVLCVFLARGLVYKSVTRKSYLPGRHRLRISDLFNPSAMPASVVMLFACAPYGGISAFIALYGDYSGLGNGGFFFMLVALGTGSTRIFSGQLSDKKGEGPLMLGGNIGFMAGLLLLLTPSGICYYLSGLCFGFGFGLSIPAMQTMSIRIVPIERRGSASSTFLCSYDIGSGLGALIAGLLVTYFGYKEMFACLTVFIVISTWLYYHWAAKTPSAFKVWQASRAALEGGK